MVGESGICDEVGLMCDVDIWSQAVRFIWEEICDNFNCQNADGRKMLGFDSLFVLPQVVLCVVIGFDKAVGECCVTRMKQSALEREAETFEISRSLLNCPSLQAISFRTNQPP